MAKGNWRDDAGKRLKEKQKAGQRFKLSEGDNSIRVLPNAKGAEYKPFIEYMMHYEVGPDKRGVRCGKSIHGEGACWLCDKMIPKLQATKKKSKMMLAEAMAPREQFVVQVAVLDGETNKFSGPHLWFVSTGGAKSLSAKLLGVIKSTKRDYIDPKKGYNLNIERTGTTKTDTNYGAIIPDEDPSKVPDSILGKVKKFGELIDQYDEEKQKAAYFGRDAEEPEEEEEEETEEEETEEGEEEETSDEDSGEEETEEEEEEEAPKSKKKGKKKPADEDEEEEEETEEEVDPDSDEDSGEEETEEEEEVPEDEEAVGDEDEDADVPEDEEEEEEESPKPKKKKKPAEEEEEEEPEEEEEEEAPKPKKKAGKLIKKKKGKK